MATLASVQEEPTRAGGEVRFWRCRDEQTEAHAVAGDIERLVFREHVDPRRIAVMLVDEAIEGRALSKALTERAIPHRSEGSAAALRRAEVRDAIAWMRLLLDSHDASAATRALLRPPIEMRHVDLAQVVQIARRRRLDVVAALPAALESPQVPPEAWERIRRFIELQREAAKAMDELAPRNFIDHLLESLGLHRGGPLNADAEVADRAASGEWLEDLATSFQRRFPLASSRELAQSLIDLDADDGFDAPQPQSRDGDVGAVQLTGLRPEFGDRIEHAYLVGLRSGSLAGDAELDELLSRRCEDLVISYPLAVAGETGCEPVGAVERLRQMLKAEWDEPVECPVNTEGLIEAALRTLRQELLDGVASIGGRLGELRLDTDVDVSHGIVRYLELVKLAALLERPAGQSVQDALADVNNRLLAAMTPLQREIFESSTLDEELLEGRTMAAQAGPGVLGAAGEPPLRRFLPRKGEGMLLSASDVQTYRSCPLRYKFARVLRIPADPTLNQRFGIALHQVLERYHAAGGGELGKLLMLLDVCWRRGGFGESEQERSLHIKATAALKRYHERLSEQASTPLWFERSFAFRLGRHQVRGRVDRVDRLADGRHELIDYKTGRPLTQEQLRQDIQLSLYALAAAESWQLQSSQQAYYYLLDDEKVPLPEGGPDPEWVRDTVTEVGESILRERFDPTPSKRACGICDYRIVCPVAEG